MKKMEPIAIKVKRTLEYYRRPILIAIIQWFITTLFQVDRLFFVYECENRYLVATKLLYLCFLVIAWCFTFNAIKKIQSGDSLWVRGKKLFLGYLLVAMLLLLVLWPGTWSWDDLRILNAVSTYGGWFAWQHVLTGIYYDVLLQIVPFPGGIILLQNIIIALCVAFIITKLENVFNIKKFYTTGIDLAVKFFPFLLPPILMYSFSGYRMGIYVYIELVMLIMLISAHRENKEWGFKYTILFSVLCVITATWRTESFLYIPSISLLILFVRGTIISNSKKTLCIVIIVIGSFGINIFQSQQLGNANYKVISLLGPCAELVRVADYDRDKKELEIIDKVTDIEVIAKNPTLNGEELYWDTGCVRNRNDDPDDDYTVEDYKNFLRAFTKLSLKYPKVVISERWNMFVVGSGITGECRTNVSNAAELFEEHNGNVAVEEVLNKGWLAFSPVYKKMRHFFINFLGVRKNNGNYIIWLKSIVYNAIVPELFLLFALIQALIRRKWFFAGISLAVLIRLPIVVLTQPSPWIMYVLSFYFLGYVFLVYMLLIRWSRSRGVSKSSIIVGKKEIDVKEL